MVINETSQHRSEPALHPSRQSLLSMPGHANASVPVGKWQGLRFMLSQDISFHGNMQMFSVFKMTPGSITVDILSCNSGVAANGAAKWSTLKVLSNPLPGTPMVCSQPMFYDSWGNFTSHPWLLEYHYPFVWTRLDQKQNMALSIKSYQTPTTSLTSLLGNCYPPFPPWGPQESGQGMTLRSECKLCSTTLT